jgi:hypothetical protein
MLGSSWLLLFFSYNDHRSLDVLVVVPFLVFEMLEKVARDV